MLAVATPSRRGGSRAIRMASPSHVKTSVRRKANAGRQEECGALRQRRRQSGYRPPCGRKANDARYRCLVVCLSRVEQAPTPDCLPFRFPPREARRVAGQLDLVREPDAGNPHVRFDERRLETESWRGVRRRRRRKPPGTATPSAYRHRASRRLYTNLVGTLAMATLVAAVAFDVLNPDYSGGFGFW